MALPITIPNTFANATTSIPLANLDANFTTVVNAINGIGNGTEALANVSITGGSISNVAISGSNVANSQVNVLAGTGLSGGGNLAANVTLAIANTTVAAGTYGNATAVSTFTVNAQGQLTAASNTVISIPNTQVTGLGTMSTQNASAVAITGGNANSVTMALVTINSGNAVFTTANATNSTITNMSSSNVTITGGTASNISVDFQDKLATRPTLKDYSINGEVLGLLNANTALNFSNANFFSATANANVTISFSNPSAANTLSGCVLALTNGGSKTITWSNVAWSGNTAPSLTSNGLDILVFVTYDGGSTVNGMVASYNSFK